MKAFRIVNMPATGRINSRRFGNVRIADLTDEQAAWLHAQGCRYLEPVAASEPEPQNPKPETGSSSPNQKSKIKNQK